MSQFTEMLRQQRGPIVENYRRSLALASLFMPETQRTAEDEIRLRWLTKSRRVIPPPKDLTGAEVLSGDGDGMVTFLLPDGRTVTMTVSGYEADIEWEETLISPAIP